MILNNNSTQQINTLVIQLQNRITNLNNELKSLNKEIDDLDSKISDLEIRDSSNANDQAKDIAAMNTQITENKNNIAANSNSIAAMNTQITENKNNIAANSNSIAAMNTQINTNKSDISALANLMNVVYENITSECSAINNTVIVNAVYGYKQGNRVSLTFDVVTNGSTYAIIHIPQRYTTRNADFSHQWWNYSIYNQSVVATTNQAGEFYVMYNTTVPAGVSFIQTFDYYI